VATARGILIDKCGVARRLRYVRYVCVDIIL